MQTYFEKKSKITKKAIIVVGIVLIVVVAIFAWIKFGKREINVDNTTGILNKFASPTQAPVGPLKGTTCATAQAGKDLSRPFAVMLASDPEARPLAGLGSADIVIEMPVTEGGVTRMMAIYQCALPTEFGSIRSARLDFIPLVKGFDALFMHWGGEHEALAKLNARIDEMKTARDQTERALAMAKVRPRFSGMLHGRTSAKAAV